MKKNLMFLALATIGLASCNGGFKKGDAGMLYNIHTDKSGPNAKIGDFLIVNLTVKNDADSLLFSTYDNGRPAPLVLQASQRGDVYDGMKYLSEGDSATIKIFADSVMKKGQRPPNFKGKYIVYTIKVEKVIPKGTQTDAVFQGTIATYMKSQTDKLQKDEPAKIQKYIADNKLTLNKTPEGLNYVITQQGSGPMPAAGDTVLVNYVGKQVNGKIFETSVKEEAIKAKLPINPMNPYQPIHVVLGQAGVIAGWEIGLKLLNKGAKATFVIPSDLGYKDQGNGPIGPYTPLIFDLELVNIIHPNPNAAKPVAPLTLPQPIKK